jgi:hypothetical protein
MDSQLRMCRVCQAVRDESNDGELVPIFEKSNKIAFGIYLISQIKVSTLLGFVGLLCKTSTFLVSLDHRMQ